MTLFIKKAREVSSKYHKIGRSISKRLRIYTIVVFSFVRTFAP